MVDENGELLPRKRRWPWVLAVVAGLIALLVAAGYLYNFYWQHKVDALFASYRAQGQPVTREEVLAARDKLPAEENSALIFQGAFAEARSLSDSAEIAVWFAHERGRSRLQALAADPRASARLPGGPSAGPGHHPRGRSPVHRRLSRGLSRGAG